MIQIIVSAILMIAIICIGIIIRDGNRFVIVENTIRSHKIRKHYSFVLLSDLHNKSYGDENEKLFRAIQKINPDGVIVAGDMYTAEPKGGFENALALLQKLSGDYPIYYANGNHEQKTNLYRERYGDRYDRYVKSLKNYGVTHLVNERLMLPEYNIDICGSQIGKQFFQRFTKYPMEKTELVDLVGTAREDRFQILIAHNPDYFPEYADWGADLVLSGHIHGGIVRVPFLGGMLSPSVRFFPKYDGGVFTEENSTMVLSRGLGTHSLPIRMLNPAELVVVHLEPGK